MKFLPHAVRRLWERPETPSIRPHYFGPLAAGMEFRWRESPETRATVSRVTYSVPREVHFVLVVELRAEFFGLGQPGGQRPIAQMSLTEDQFRAAVFAYDGD